MKQTLDPKIPAYIALLKEYNERFNLYSKKSYDKLDFHIQDGLALASIIPTEARVLADIGSGSGFPSVILAIVKPNMKIYAIESKLKKSGFLKVVQAELGLPNYTVFHDDANAVRLPQRPDVITAKAVGPYEKVEKIAAKMAKKQTALIIPISENQVDATRENKAVRLGKVHGDDGTIFYFLRKDY